MKLDEHIAAINAAVMGSDMRAPLIAVFKDLYEAGKDADLLVDTKGNKYKVEGFASDGEIELKLKSDFLALIPPDTVPKKDSSKIVKSNGIYAMIGDLESLRGLLPSG